MFVGDRVKVVCDYLMANGKIGIVEAILPDDFVSVRFGDGTYGSYKEFNLRVILMEDDAMEQQFKVGDRVKYSGNFAQATTFSFIVVAVTENKVLIAKYDEETKVEDLTPIFMWANIENLSLVEE